MLKFKFNYLKSTLAYQTESLEANLWYEITETFIGNFGSLGFQLTEGWITFSVYSNKIRVFYKQISQGADPTDFWEPQTLAYFRKDLPKQVPVIFTFTHQDEVEKRGNAWVKKGEPNM